MQCGIKAPNYVRAVKISNQTNSKVTVTSFFQSGEKINYEIPEQTTIDIEKGIDHGTYTTVDPIESIVAKNPSGMLQSIEFHPHGVEIHEYTLINKDNQLLFEKTQKDENL